MSTTMIPVILCGGSGTRLWPVSRHLFPKQFHALTGGPSLFQQTFQRCTGAGASGQAVVVTGEDYRFLVAEQLDAIGAGQSTVILEPAARNTGPAITLAALHLAESEPDSVMLVAPSDHFIRDEGSFARTIRAAEEAAKGGNLVTLGVSPDRAATSYGYIKCSSQADDSVPPGCRRVERFVEKPDARNAERFLNEGGYFWNSGMFLFTPAAFLDELAACQPEILDACERAWKEADNQFGFKTVGSAYREAPSLSIDYAIMEKTARAVLVPYSGDWSDIGSWSGLAAASGDQADSDGNRVTGNVRLHNVADSVIHASSRLVTGVGLRNAVVVETKDAVLVSTREDDQDVREIVELLKSDGAPEVEHHTRVSRPWGAYEDLDKGEGFHVKRLMIKPGASISLQRHFHRSEHWVVVQGEATVIRNDEEFQLGRNESTFIPREAVHKLTNNTQEDLVIIEVQTGDYLDESDIERLKDDYGRA